MKFRKLNKGTKPGDYKAVCDRTGRICYARDMQLEWNNTFVYKDVYFPRQPQDFIRGVEDDQTVPIPRPEGEPRFIDATQLGPDDF